jgi:prevent-host-death family protein
MIVANIHEAKTNLSKLISAVMKGEEIILAKSGLPVAKITQLNQDKILNSYGKFKNKIFMPDNFNEEDSKINKLFYE